MPGIRIRHRNARNAVVTIEHPKPYTAPFLCPTCTNTHQKKTYHLQVDDKGETVVSEIVAARLKEAGAIGAHSFEVLDAVENPPPIVLNIGAGPQRFRVARSR